MTLEERIEDLVSLVGDGDLYSYEASEIIFELAEEFAIEFAEWVCKCEYNIQWFKDQNKTNELLEMYKETL